MILDFIINLFNNLVGFFVNLLPTSSFDSGFVTSVHSLFSGAYAYNSLFPIDTLFTVLTATITLIVIVFLWRGINYIFSLIRGN